MAIDLSKVRSKLDNLKSRGNKRNNLWKPKPGTAKIRIVPYRFNKDYPFIELYFHYNFPGKSYLSPYSFGRPDPIVQFAEEVKQQPGQENYNLYKKLMPKMRTFAPVVVRGEEDQGVRFWGFGKTIYQQLLNTLADPDYGDFTDLQNGQDIKVEYIPKAQSNTNFPKTNLLILPDRKPLMDDVDEMRKLIENQQKITDVFHEPSFDDLQEALEDYLRPDEEEEGESRSATASVSSSNGSSNSSGSSVSDVSDEFDDLFND